MPPSVLLVLALSTAACALGCAATSAEHGPEAVDSEAARVLDALNAETRAALGRDYEAWRRHWVHAPYVVKTYTDEADGTSSVMLGWDRVDAFVRTYIEDHPEPEPAPTPIEQADVRLYGDLAWVVYDQENARQGWKREARRLERTDGAWRIAAMHTTIYGATPPE